MGAALTARIGVAGVGLVGERHARIVDQEATLAGIADPSPAASGIARSMGVPLYPDVDAMVAAGDLDGVIVATPNQRHAMDARTCINAGLPVLVEKPITSNPEDAGELVRLAKENGCVLQVGHVERFNPVFTYLTEAARKPKFIEVHRLSPYPARSLDIGVVMDLMIHDLDLVLSMSDAPVQSVSASGIAVVSDHEDIAEARIEFEDGLVANLKASPVSPAPARDMQVYGSNGFAQIDFGKPALSTVRPCDSMVNRSFRLADETDNPLGYADQLFAGKLNCGTQELEPRNAILDELHDFVISIQTGTAPTVDGSAGARAVSVADKILRAIDQRAWYAEPTGQEVGPHAVAREGIQRASRRTHQNRRAA